MGVLGVLIALYLMVLCGRGSSRGGTVNDVSERIYCEKIKGSQSGSLFGLLQEAVQEAVSQHVFGLQ